MGAWSAQQTIEIIRQALEDHMMDFAMIIEDSQEELDGTDVSGQSEG